MDFGSLGEWAEGEVSHQREHKLCDTLVFYRYSERQVVHMQVLAFSWTQDIQPHTVSSELSKCFLCKEEGAFSDQRGCVSDSNTAAITPVYSYGNQRDKQDLCHLWDLGDPSLPVLYTWTRKGIHVLSCKKKNTLNINNSCIPN